MSDWEEEFFESPDTNAPSNIILEQWKSIKSLLDEARTARKEAENREARAFAILEHFKTINSDYHNPLLDQEVDLYVQQMVNHRYKRETGNRCLRQKKNLDKLRTEELELVEALNRAHIDSQRDRREHNQLKQKLEDVRAAKIALRHRTDLPLDSGDVAGPSSSSAGSEDRKTTSRSGSSMTNSTSTSNKTFETADDASWLAYPRQRRDEREDQPVRFYPG